jgi:hypothetical protein
VFLLPAPAASASPFSLLPLLPPLPLPVTLLLLAPAEEAVDDAPPFPSTSEDGGEVTVEDGEGETLRSRE